MAAAVAAGAGALVAVGAGADVVVGGTGVGVLAVTAVGTVVGVAVASGVEVPTAAEMAVGVGVASSLAAWPKLARNTEKAIRMARICLTAYLPPEPSVPPSRHTSANYPLS